MDYISQIFLSTKDILRIYLAINDPYYLNIAQEKSNSSILVWNDFIKQDINIYINVNKNIQCIYCLGYLYILDFNGNYIKIRNYEIIDTYIYELQSFNDLWVSFHTLFAEFYVGDIKFITKNKLNNYFRLENNKWVRIPFNGIAIYTNNKKIIQFDSAKSLCHI